MVRALALALVALALAPASAFAHATLESTVPARGARLAHAPAQVVFKFDEAVSFAIECETQDEIDYYWGKLLEGGEESQCGWLKDRFGLSWQVVPTGMEELFADPDKGRAERAMKAMLEMKKIDIAALRRAADASPTT